jgi:single-strand DNA-binding protein
VYLEGRLQTRKYDDRNGNPRTSTEVVVSTLRLLGGPKEGASHAEADQGRQASAMGNGSAEDTEDIPF